MHVRVLLAPRSPVEKGRRAAELVFEPGPPHVETLDVRLIDTTLKAEGVRILTATDGESAVPLARQEHPTLILLDMDLPGIDGLAVCRMLRAESDRHLRDIPILMLSGIMLEEADLVEAFSAGATDYLTKPFKPTLLRSRVHAWLSRTVTT